MKAASEQHADAARNGYLFWTPIAAAILATELLGIGWVEDHLIHVRWPTISTTVGHLEDKWGAAAVAVVGLIAGIALHALLYRNPKLWTGKGGAVEVVAPRSALEFTPQGVPLSQGRPLRIDRNSPEPLHFYTWYVGLTLVILGVAAGFFVAHLTDDRYWRGYFIYGSFLIFGIALPSILIRVNKEVGFPTAFYWFRSIRGAFPAAAAILIAGMAVLTLHLALYPWPNISFESKRYAGLRATEARVKAERAVKGRDLEYTAQIRGIDANREAWIVYFNQSGKPASPSGCVVVVTKDFVKPDAGCLA